MKTWAPTRFVATVLALLFVASSARAAGARSFRSGVDGPVLAQIILALGSGTDSTGTPQPSGNLTCSP